MIRFLCTRRNDYPVRAYLQTHGAPLVGVLVPMHYDELFEDAEPPAAAYCFAALDRLSDAERERAAEVWQQLEARGCRLLNHPTRSLRRYDLLRMLNRRGVNRFDVHRLRDGADAARYPVFLRRESDHKGRRSPLLRSPGELRAAVAAIQAEGKRTDDLLVVEFVDTADLGGVYRKYGAFVVGDRVLARHVFFSSDWQVKSWDLMDDARLREEQDYVASNPHAARLREVFAAAAIGYGRIDYSLLGGDLQVWEINTNPMIAGLIEDMAPQGALARTLWRLRGLSARRDADAARRPRAVVHTQFAATIEAAFRALEPGGGR